MPFSFGKEANFVYWQQLQRGLCRLYYYLPFTKMQSDAFQFGIYNYFLPNLWWFRIAPDFGSQRELQFSIEHMRCNLCLLISNSA